MWVFQVAEDNYKALLSFFVKFPNFTQNDFFIFGESYGGIYVPTLSLRVVSGTAKIKFKVGSLNRVYFQCFLAKNLCFQGFAVGNGLCSFALNDQSLIYFGYYHGLFGEEWVDLHLFTSGSLLPLLFFPYSRGDITVLQWIAADGTHTF